MADLHFATHDAMFEQFQSHFNEFLGSHLTPFSQSSAGISPRPSPPDPARLALIPPLSRYPRDSLFKECFILVFMHSMKQKFLFLIILKSCLSLNDVDSRVIVGIDCCSDDILAYIQGGTFDLKNGGKVEREQQNFFSLHQIKKEIGIFRQQSSNLTCFMFSFKNKENKNIGNGGIGDGFPPLSRTPPACQSRPFSVPSRFPAEGYLKYFTDCQLNMFDT